MIEQRDPPETDAPMSWHEANSRFLAAALAWLRLLLERQAWREQSPATLPIPLASAAAIGALTVPAPGVRSPVTDEQVEQAAAAMASAEQTEPPLALATLCARLSLTRAERDVVLLCAASELDTGIAALCARAQDDPARPYPTFALALTLFDDLPWNSLSPTGTLRSWRLIEVVRAGAQPLLTSLLRVDERIVAFLKGLNELDERLVPLFLPFEDTAASLLAPSQEKLVARIIQLVQEAAMHGRLPPVQLLGADSAAKQAIARQVAAAFGVQIYRLPAGSLPSGAEALEAFNQLWTREGALLPLALYLEIGEGGRTEPAQGPSSLDSYLLRADGLLFVDAREHYPAATGALLVDVAKPTAAEQESLWRDALGGAQRTLARRLAGQFSLDAGAIRRIALAQSGNDVRLGGDNLWDACRDATRPQLNRLAQRLESIATWDDLVLPEEEKGLLRQIAAQVEQRSLVYDRWGFRERMNRGLGISALFAGVSGAGKTMAAEVIANALRLTLYRIDLSAVVSKYIGETERNLRHLFDSAEDGGVVLLFDEADALFGKRSEVKDSHDRYANIEVNYLLQRLEAFSGLVILASNMKSALDEAFLRRLRFVVTFPFPGVVERRQIWQRAFPPSTPTGDLDFDRLARLNLTGGSIHTIALNAAFLAAGARPARVTMPLVLAAARAEFRKLERPVNESDFLWNEPREAVRR